LPFPTTIPASERDPHLVEKLTEASELSGLLNKAIAALPHVLRAGVTETASMGAERNELKLHNEPVLQYLRDHIAEDPDARVGKRLLFERVQRFCRNTHEFIPTEPEIAKLLKREFPCARDCRPRQDGGRTTAWAGIRWDDDDYHPSVFS
jgi:hypothetical protein